MTSRLPGRKNFRVDVLVYGLAGMAIGLGALIAYILKQRGSKEASDSLAAENRLLKEEIQRAQQVENSRAKNSASRMPSVLKRPPLTMS